MKFFAFLFTIVAFVAIALATGWDDLNSNLSSIQSASTTFGNTETSGTVTAQTAASIVSNANALAKAFDAAYSTLQGYSGTITANQYDLIANSLSKSANGVSTGEKNIIAIAATLKSNNAGDKVGTALNGLYASVKAFASGLTAKANVSKIQQQTDNLQSDTQSGCKAFGKC